MVCTLRWDLIDNFLSYSQDFPEVVSHQDSLPEFGMMNQSSQLGAFKSGGMTGRFSMSPSVTTSNKRHSCPPIPIHLQQKGSPGASSSPMNRKGFSPAGHIHKGSPHHHHGISHHHHEGLLFYSFLDFLYL